MSIQMDNLISLKDYFGGEASGFTPWLAEHEQIVKDIIEADAQLYKKEAKVDSYYIDLMFRSGKDIYVVENQYGESNHDHLGKCIVYSSLVGAKKTVWIAEEFSNEYQKIFTSLNIDLILCSVCMEKINEDYVLMKCYILSKKGMRQIIYKLDNDKNVIKTIKSS